MATLVTLGHEDGSKMSGDDTVVLCDKCLEHLRSEGHLPRDPFRWTMRREREVEPCEDEMCDGCSELLEVA